MRAELKYLVPERHLEALRNAIMPMVQLDNYGQRYGTTGYTVRSIYLDTSQLKFYHEKLDGIKKRKKLRVRAYNTKDIDSKVFLEIKRKLESKISKTRANIPLTQLPDILHEAGPANFDWSTSDEQNQTSAKNFLYHLHRKQLRCVNLVVYEREAFEGKTTPTLRITFDKNLRSKLCSTFDDLYATHNLVSILPGHFILEIKYNYDFPSWLTPILSSFKLQKQALSKYCMSLERCSGQHESEATSLLKTRFNHSAPLI